MLTGKETSKQFGAALRRLGYEKLTTYLWNNRPAYWQRKA
jgi:hypothetical protein